MERYDFTQIETKWQQRWDEGHLYRTEDPSKKPKYYCLDFFPYPSGDGLSVGHCRNYVPTDAISRYKRMRGYNVLHPMGWDAFGLPAENEAILKGSHPKVTVPRYVANYKRQLKLIGTSYDWDREINSSTADYYRWTQWFFLLLHKRGLAYRADAPVNWCPSCATVLANEEVEQNACWRCHSQVTKKGLSQWMFRITAYADRLIADLDIIEWPERIKSMQRNWIGRSVGVAFNLPVKGRSESIRVFTTRPDTVYGMTFAVLAPEHPLVEQLTTSENAAAVNAYVTASQSQSEIERLSTEKERTGVFLGSYAINPMNQAEIPIFIGDYVLMTYGSGAIMAVPAHDTRDFDFARRYGLPIPVVISPPGWSGTSLAEAYVEEGTMVNSGPFNGLPSKVGAEAVADHMEQHGLGEREVHYRMRDWLISRQRYWGAPIPIIHCAVCGEVPVPEDQLPVLLPDLERYQPSGTGRSPLANVSDFVEVICPRCGGGAQRETDTMGGFACSSWYFLRYASPHHHESAFDRASVRYWLPVDLYVGGAEHAVMHLLYARFWTKVMFDEGLISFKEPFFRLMNQGMVLAPDPDHPGQFTKMSKSKGNVVTPDEVVAKYGADTLRIYELFVAPFEQEVTWRDEDISGAHRFLGRVWRLVLDSRDTFISDWSQHIEAVNNQGSDPEKKLRRKLHQTIRKVTEDLESFKFNTAVAALMELVNATYDFDSQRDSNRGRIIISEVLENLVLLLSPMAPHLAEELWERLGRTSSVHRASWPEMDAMAAQEEKISLVVQVNGKVRGHVEVPVDLAEPELKEYALACPSVAPYCQEKQIRKVIVVGNKLVNIVVA